MRIIEQSHEVLHMDGLDRIELAGRVCYKSEDKIGCTLPEDAECTFEKESMYGFGPVMVGEPGTEECACAQADCPNHSAARFVRMLIKRGHHAMLEHGGATVRFITDRGVTHEMVRHRLSSFGQESTRYCDYGDQPIQYIRPPWISEDSLEQLGREWTISDWEQHMEQRNLDEAPLMVEEMWIRNRINNELNYKWMRRHGQPPEQARGELDHCVKTEIVWTANYREWRHILNLRAIGTTGKPHPSMKAIMLPVLAHFQQALPAMFGDLGGPE